MTEQSQLGPSQDGTVMLDIGGHVGALILHTGPDLLLVEIEISRLDGARPLAEGFEIPGEHTHTHDGASHSHTHGHGGDDGGAPRTHVAIRERVSAAGTRYAAIYPGVYDGDYQLWRADGTPAEVITIVGGEVLEVDWR